MLPAASGRLRISALIPRPTRLVHGFPNLSDPPLASLWPLQISSIYCFLRICNCIDIKILLDKLIFRS